MPDSFSVSFLELLSIVQVIRSDLERLDLPFELVAHDSFELWRDDSGHLHFNREFFKK